MDSLFFSNIAKLRAIRHLCEVFKERFSLGDFEVISEPSLREMTIYDPWMNMLRQTSNLASAFIGGADILSVHAHDLIYKNLTHAKVSALGVRQSRNQFHVLKEESFLSRVKDPAKGSYALESLTRELIEKSFDLFKNWEAQKGLLKNLETFSRDVKEVSIKRREYLATNKVSIAGVNSFSHLDEKFEFNLNSDKEDLFPLRRTSEEFELLREKAQQQKIKNILLVCGEESKLSGRIMFCTNYFEVLGHQVDILFYKDDVKKYVADNVIVCALDEEYQNYIEKLSSKIHGKKYIAGKKFSQKDYTNVYAGQNILKILSLAMGEH